jgi:hypothetical protein
MTDLSDAEKQFTRMVSQDLRFYGGYKKFMGEVKLTFLNKGPEAAKQLIRSRTDDILQLACDELFYDLFTNI